MMISKKLTITAGLVGAMALCLAASLPQQGPPPRAENLKVLPKNISHKDLDHIWESLGQHLARGKEYQHRSVLRIELFKPAHLPYVGVPSDSEHQEPMYMSLHLSLESNSSLSTDQPPSSLVTGTLIVSVHHGIFTACHSLNSRLQPYSRILYVVLCTRSAV